jgi:hypothetical protein
LLPTKFTGWEGFERPFDGRICFAESDDFAPRAFDGGRLIPSDERSNQSSFRGLDAPYVRALQGGTVLFTLVLAGRGEFGLETRSIISTGIVTRIGGESDEIDRTGRRL